MFWVWFILSLFLLLGLVLRLECLEITRLNFWLTRDFDRAFNLFDGNFLPLAGPETTNGLRLPGPFLYFILVIPLWFHYSYESLFVFYGLLNFSSIILMFLILRKYFSFGIAFLTTLLQSISLLSIEGVAFPINPAFLLPLIPFLFWCLFEFALKKNQGVLPWMVLVCSLGVQIHLSIVIFLIVPIIWATLFKIKISIQTIIKTLIVIGICFTPYMFYSFYSYKPIVDVSHVTAFDPFLNFWAPLKILAVQNTIIRLADFGIGIGNMSNFLGASKFCTALQYILFNCSLFGLGGVIFLNAKKRGLNSCQPKLIVVFLFYFPALIYDLIQPMDIHYWYNYIFITPTALLVATFLYHLWQIISQRAISIFIKSGIVFLIGYFAIFNTSYIYKTKKLAYNPLQYGDYINFRVLNLFLKNLIPFLGISPWDYIDRVYFDGVTPYSKNMIILASSGKNKYSRTEQKDQRLSCFYISNIDRLHSFSKKEYNLLKNNLDSLTNDVTIKILSTKIFNYHGSKFFVKEYLRKFNQPCYVNSNNVFSSDIHDKNLLDDYAKFQKQSDPFLKKSFHINSSGQLRGFDVRYLYFNPDLNLPIRFTIDLSQKPDHYEMRTEVSFYGWGKSDQNLFTFKSLSLKFLGQRNTDKKPVEFFLPVVSPNSWLGDGYGTLLEKFNWYRSFKLHSDYKLNAGTLSFHFKGEIRFPNRDPQCCLKFNLPIEIDLNHSS